MEMVELEDVMDSQINQNTTTEQEFRLPDEIGILPIRSAVAYPGTVMPLAVGRERSKRLIADIEPQKTIFGLVAQKNPDAEDHQAGEQPGDEEALQPVALGQDNQHGAHRAGRAGNLVGRAGERADDDSR